MTVNDGGDRMHATALFPFFSELLERALPDGSFVVASGTPSRPDATAWAAMALHASGMAPDVVAAARQSLAAFQLPDGSVPVVPECPSAAWPTPLAILAWLPEPAFHPHAKAAAAWLASHQGRRWPRSMSDIGVLGHDPSLRGWSWTIGAHSWVEPTALAMLALTAMGQAESIMELAEATMMLLDRELPEGGWNYGNTRVFLNILPPLPECTGFALTALGAFPMRPDRCVIARSLDYLASHHCAFQTPLIAAWRAFGLMEWKREIPGLMDDLVTTLERQDYHGPYNTSLLAQLLAAIVTNGKFSALTESMQRNYASV